MDPAEEARRGDAMFADAEARQLIGDGAGAEAGRNSEAFH